jgi:hypothetical protein
MTPPKVVTDAEVVIAQMLETQFFEDGLASDLHGYSVPEAYRQGYYDAINELKDRLASRLQAIVARESLQSRVQPWMIECFGAEIAGDKLERGDRFLEESLELLQSGDYPQERVAALVEYVYGRPKGEPSQEVGGVRVTLSAYCLAFDIDEDAAAETELARILRPEIIAKIRLKHASKKVGSALPMCTPPTPAAPAAQKDGQHKITDADGQRAHSENYATDAPVFDPYLGTR